MPETHSGTKIFIKELEGGIKFVASCHPACGFAVRRVVIRVHLFWKRHASCDWPREIS